MGVHEGVFTPRSHSRAGSLWWCGGGRSTPPLVGVSPCCRCSRRGRARQVLGFEGWGGTRCRSWHLRIRWMKRAGTNPPMGQASTLQSSGESIALWTGCRPGVSLFPPPPALGPDLSSGGPTPSRPGPAQGYWLATAVGQYGPSVPDLQDSPFRVPESAPRSAHCRRH
jgi:hypothetical protein